MQFNTQQFSTHCQRATHDASQFATFYLLDSDEVWLKQQTIKALKARAREEYTEQLTYTMDTASDFDTFMAELPLETLFASKRLFLCHFKSIPTADMKTQLAQLVEKDLHDLCLIFSLPKLTKAQKQQTWYTTLEQAGIALTLYPISERELPTWLAKRLQRYNLQATPDALLHFAACVTGNLAQAASEIEKLSLYFTAPYTVTLADMQQTILSNSQYDNFALANTVIDGNLEKALSLLEQFQQQGVATMGVLWVLMREAKRLQQLHCATNQQTAMRQEGIFSTRQRAYQQALTRVTLENCQRALSLANTLDRVIKGLTYGNAWHLLRLLTSELTGTPIMRISEDDCVTY